jgi:O-methyltransferase
MPNHAAELYLDMVKRSLLNVTYVDMEAAIAWLIFRVDQARSGKNTASVDLRRLNNFEVDDGGLIDQIKTVVKDGSKVRPLIHLMMGEKRLNNIHDCLNKIIADNVPGDFLEAGVWKGGGTIFMRAFLAAHGIRDRLVWAADSFQGVPPPTLTEDKGFDLTANKLSFIAISEERVRGLFERYGLLDDQVKFLPGWFKDTLPTASVEKIALLRLDGDLYESTMDALVPLYDRVSPGGFIIVDDYNDIPPCKKAIDEFRARRGITDPIISIDWTGVYWRKSAG